MQQLPFWFLFQYGLLGTVIFRRCSHLIIWEHCSHLTLSERPILYNYATRYGILLKINAFMIQIKRFEVICSKNIRDFSKIAVLVDLGGHFKIPATDTIFGLRTPLVFYMLDKRSPKNVLFFIFAQIIHFCQIFDVFSILEYAKPLEIIQIICKDNFQTNLWGWT